MKNTNSLTKKVYKTFFAWNEKKEQDWLESMSSKGWHLKKVGFMNYIFEKGLPKKYIYRFDFKITLKDDLGDYLAIFEDLGWEFVDRFSSWYYFRIDPENQKEKSLEIYSDNLSKVKKYQRLIIFLLIVTGPMVYFSIPKFIERSILSYGTGTGILFIALTAFSVIIESLVIFAIIRFFIIISRLKRNIKE
jgi:hypothetical protein